MIECILIAIFIKKTFLFQVLGHSYARFVAKGFVKPRHSAVTKSFTLQKNLTSVKPVARRSIGAPLLTPT